MSKKWIVIFIFLSGCMSLGVLYLRGFTHNYPKREIELLAEIELGGTKQWIMANGKNDNLPVLLWIHGGPGSSQMAVARYYNNNLEEEFIVVHWDQRGAGKSNFKNFDESTMTIEQFISDIHELTLYLKEHFKRDKIYLLGHSWGTQIGMVAASRYPEDYIAYIGVGQIANMDKSQFIAYGELRERINQKANVKDLELLASLGEPPYRDHETYITFANMMNKYNMNMDIKISELIRVALGSGIYKMGDYKKWLDGANRGSGPMWEESQGWDIIQWVPKIDVPVFFIAGENDYNTPIASIKELNDKLVAVKGKELIVFKNSAHMPFFAEPNLFFDEMVRIKDLTKEQ